MFCPFKLDELVAFNCGCPYVLLLMLIFAPKFLLLVNCWRPKDFYCKILDDLGFNWIYSRSFNSPFFSSSDDSYSYSSSSFIFYCFKSCYSKISILLIFWLLIVLNTISLSFFMGRHKFSFLFSSLYGNYSS